MNAFRVLARREFLEAVRSTSYRVTTVLSLLVVVALAFLPGLLASLQEGRPQTVALLDQGTGLGPAVERLARAEPSPRLRLVPWTGPAEEAQVEAALRRGNVAGLLWLRPAAGPEAVEARYFSRQSQPATLAALSAAVNQAALPLRLERAGISPSAFRAATAPLRVRAVTLAPAPRAAELLVTQGLGYFLMLFLYVALVMFGARVFYGVTTEKTSRIAEVLLVAARADALLLSKLVGLGAAGLLQFLLMAAAGLAVGRLRPGPSPLGGLRLSAVPAEVWLWFVLFFLVGFLMYSALYAAMGSMVGRPEEAQNASSLPTLVPVAAYLVALAAVVDPGGRLATAASFVPFLTPMIMFVRVVTLRPPLGQPLLGLALNAALLVLLLRWAARVYRDNLLVQEPFSLRRVFRPRARPAG